MSSALSYLPSIAQNVLKPEMEISSVRLIGQSQSEFIQSISFRGEFDVFVVTNVGHFFHYEFRMSDKFFSLISERSLVSNSDDYHVELFED